LEAAEIQQPIKENDPFSTVPASEVENGSFCFLQYVLKDRAAFALQVSFAWAVCQGLPLLGELAMRSID